MQWLHIFHCLRMIDCRDLENILTTESGPCLECGRAHQPVDTKPTHHGFAPDVHTMGWNLNMYAQCSSDTLQNSTSFYFLNVFGEILWLNNTYRNLHSSGASHHICVLKLVSSYCYLCLVPDVGSQLEPASFKPCAKSSRKHWTKSMFSICDYYSFFGRTAIF